MNTDIKISCLGLIGVLLCLSAGAWWWGIAAFWCPITIVTTILITEIVICKKENDEQT